MDKDMQWLEFKNSGKIEDYLKYKSIEKSIEETSTFDEKNNTEN